MPSNAVVTLVMGSASDLPIVESCENILRELSIPFATRVCSAHRTPDDLKQLIEQSVSTQIFIGFAGRAAHLSGVLAAHTHKPVIGVPVASGKLLGFDALLSTVQMPPGVPVATVDVDGGANAGMLAARILSLSDKDLEDRLVKKISKGAEKVRASDKEVSNRS